MAEAIAELPGKEEQNNKNVSDAAGQLGKLSVDVTEAEKASVAVAKPEEKKETETKAKEPSKG